MGRKLVLLLGCALLLAGCGPLPTQEPGLGPPVFCNTHGIYDCSCGGTGGSAAGKKQAAPAHSGAVGPYRNK